MRIAITGPESTGKSFLSKNLSLVYQSTWVPEYARDYVTKKNGLYTKRNLTHIAQKQFELNNKPENSKIKPLFCDTEITVIKIWSQVRFNSCSKIILDLQAKQVFDLYLLCDIDIPWEDDPLREHPNYRKELFEMYLNEMYSNNYNFRIVKGNFDERLKNCVELLQAELKLFSNC